MSEAPTAPHSSSVVASRRRRTPATNINKKAVPAMIIMVPRSGCTRTSNETTPTMANSGSIQRSGSDSNRSRLRDSRDAPAATTANFASSEGCSENGPTWIHRAAPPDTVPTEGCSTRTSNPTETMRSGTQARSQTRYGSRDVASRHTAPMAAYSSCRLKNRKLDPYAANAEMELADSTMTRPTRVSADTEIESVAST